ncbi:formyltetrahydrofolate deformylase [Variovorax sp. AFSI2.2]|uniref:formyltetrahydrofolate deformylase n=1 Tax=Variovorax sp. AFSI2.2 TaxID=3384160 RepID=UPI003EBE5476
MPSLSYVLSLTCNDRRGIVSAVSRFLSDRNGNIEEAAQFNDQEAKRFFMRIAFTMQEEAVSLQDLRSQFANTAEEFGMEWQLVDTQVRMPTVIMVSKLGHCLHDLLLRWKTGLLPIDVRAIVSNHRDFYQLAASYDIPFHHIPVSPDTKAEAEAELLRIVGGEKAELVVLARYMQVLSDDLCRKLAGKAINIHHSFLPGFKGAKPYYQAYERGVKLIGATAHYVTGDLDEGPIIEQGVERADHAMSPAALTSLGRDVESVVLARAVKWHAEHRLIPNGSRTVVFK